MMHLYVFGDKSRYQFLRRLGTSLGTDEALGKTFVLYNSYQDSILAGEEIFCPALPLNTSVVFPHEMESPSISIWDTILFFDEFPFRTDYKIELLSSLCQSNKSVRTRIVLYRNKRHFLSTDISTEPEAWNEALEQYKNEGYEVFTYTDDDNAMPFLFWSTAIPSLPKLSNKYLQQISETRESIELMFDLDYDITYTSELAFLEAPAFLEKFSAYTPQFNGTVLQDSYKSNLVSNLFDEETEFEKIIFPLFMLYKNIMKSICNWDIEEDKKQLGKKIKSTFNKYVKTKDSKTFKGKNKSDYLLYLSKNHDDVKFKNDCVSFFKYKLKEVIKNFILEKLKKLEELVNE
ncbi:MAG: hypothetical protein IKP60_08485 [Treponema sp.]|nr:hypothetical protein [Treponema sp.]